MSALTAGTSFEVIKGYDVNWDDTVTKIILAQITQEDWFVLILMNVSAASTLLGVYSFVTFSLTLLHGKTALGLDKDKAYYEFLDKTALQRRGFLAFSGSLSFFCVLVFLEFFRKTPGVFRIPISVAFVAFLCFGLKEYNYLIESAAPIFESETTTMTTTTAETTPTTTSIASNDDTNDDDDDDHHHQSIVNTNTIINSIHR